MNPQPSRSSIDVDHLREVSEPLFAEAVAQGMHSGFSLDCDYWGRQWTDKLLEALGVYED